MMQASKGSDTLSLFFWLSFMSDPCQRISDPVACVVDEHWIWVKCSTQFGWFNHLGVVDLKTLSLRGLTWFPAIEMVILLE